VYGRIFTPIVRLQMPGPAAKSLSRAQIAFFSYCCQTWLMRAAGKTGFCSLKAGTPEAGVAFSTNQ
jgi:hypothetical protein